MLFLFLRKTFKKTVCIISLQRQRDLSHIHLFDRQFCPSHSSLAPDSFDLSIFAFIATKLSLSFPLLLEIFPFYFLLPFSLSLRHPHHSILFTTWYQSVSNPRLIHCAIQHRRKGSLSCTLI